MTDKSVGRPESADPSLDVDSGAEAIFGLLSEDLEIQDVPEGVEREAAADEAGDPDADVEADDGGSADVEVEDEEAEPETDDPDADAEDEDEDAEADEAEGELFTVKVDGDEVQVTLDEALRGYQRQEAFTRKTQALAEERRLVQESAGQLVQRQQEYLDRLEVINRALQTEEPDPALASSNPAAYAAQMRAHRAAQERIAKVETEQDRVRAEITAAYRAEKDRAVAAERELLEAKLPEWTDPDVKADETGRLVDTLRTTYGYSPEEIGNLVDHRLVLALRDAMLYQEMMQKGERARKGLQGKRKKGVTLKPGSKTAGKKQRRSRRNPARSRLAKHGRVDDAAAALLDIVEL